MMRGEFNINASSFFSKKDSRLGLRRLRS